MSNRVYGYARVSSRDQNEVRQVLALESFGVSHVTFLKWVREEKVS